MNLSLLAYQQLVDRKLSVLFCTLRMPAWISIFSKNHDIELQTLVLESFRNTMIAKNRKKIPVKIREQLKYDSNQGFIYKHFKFNFI